MKSYHSLLDEVRASLASNPYRISDSRLSLSVDQLEGRRQALTEMQARMQALAENPAVALDHPDGPVPGLAFEDEHFSKVTLAGLMANYRTSLRQVRVDLDAFNVAKAEHREILNRWAA